MGKYGDDDWIPPDSWRLADALDALARDHGWVPVQRGTSPDEVAVVYRVNTASGGSRGRRPPGPATGGY